MIEQFHITMRLTVLQQQTKRQKVFSKSGRKLAPTSGSSWRESSIFSGMEILRKRSSGLPACLLI
jgi:hypothetical protein